MWYVGAIPQYTAAVWVGHVDAQVEMVNFKVCDENAGADQAIRRAYGGTVAGLVWADFMEYVAADLEVEDFPDEPEGTGWYFRVPKTDVPNAMGLTQRKAEDAIFQAGLRAEIDKVASTEPKGEILHQSPAAGSRVSQGSVVRVRISNGVHPILLDLVGLAAAQVDSAIGRFNEETGLDLAWTRVDVPTDEPSAIDIVIRTSPGPGAIVEFEQRIRVFIGVAAPPGGRRQRLRASRADYSSFPEGLPAANAVMLPTVSWAIASSASTVKNAWCPVMSTFGKVSSRENTSS